jgi:PAT family beta-lactamase induction signal transducer AmpG
MLVLGGIIGGLAVARHGLGRWILWMAVAINLPNLVYVVLAVAMPDSLRLVTLAVAIEQFGYGFGFAGYMLYMLYLAQGKHQTAHYALCTGIMALGMMLPGMISGWVQEQLGYKWFFVWVMAATVPSFIVTWLVPIDSSFGVRESDAEGATA